MPRFAAFVTSGTLVLALTACGSSDEKEPEPEAKTIPSELTVAAFDSFMTAGNYTKNGWVSETAAPREESTGVSPHDRVRVWFNPTAVESQKAGNGASLTAPPHTVESMVVKELYDAETLVGQAAFLKTEEGSGAAGWYYYCKGPDGRCFTGSSGQQTTPLFGKNDSNCGSCHGGLIFTVAP